MSQQKNIKDIKVVSAGVSIFSTIVLLLLAVTNIQNGTTFMSNLGGYAFFIVIDVLGLVSFKYPKEFGYYFVEFLHRVGRSDDDDDASRPSVKQSQKNTKNSQQAGRDIINNFGSPKPQLEEDTD